MGIYFLTAVILNLSLAEYIVFHFHFILIRYKMLFKINFCEIKIHPGISGFWGSIVSFPSTAFYNLPQKKKEV